MQFTKWHGQGNDFVIVNGFQEKIEDYAQAAVKICDRHFGIGADGLVIVGPSQVADFRMRIFNSDGSEAEMCGNVTRCVARYVYEYGLTDKTKITLETLAGPIKPELIFENGVLRTVRVDMGEPRLKRAQIPMIGEPDSEAINVPLIVNDKTYDITCVSMGNPHCIIFVDDVDEINLAAVGPLIENHPTFPRKTNVEFVQVLNDHEMRMRVWERGAGITLACGTGASATLVAAVLNGKTGRVATIHLDGGDLVLEWGNDNHVYMSGPAVEVFRGEYLLSL
ncbi:Diaminopimelate epimerase [Thermosinus carboxydivorans Nor1]|uniref:Diaminopimelate epimerase n=1 Tax=Thermosinus carboxydivorans Nor1 TaxID=401526 RepID=A1HMY7_9FIRM|nr:diaminopimelate epimerase [Thermosinus carboxydivorans]EAX48618.1 Diaminopimelate epimerase [Thermosinus carboxydivorans Nor1]